MQIYFSIYKLSGSITYTLQIVQIRFFSLSTVLIKREQEEKEELVLLNEVELTLIKNYWNKTKWGKYKSLEYKNKLFEVQ